MPRTCTVCRHPERQAINVALVGALASFETLGLRHGLSASALRRHKATHVPAMLFEAKASNDFAEASSLTDNVHAVRKRVSAILETAEAGRDFRTALAAVRELRSVDQFLARLAEKSEAAIPISVAKHLVDKMMEVLGEFVPPGEIDAAVARLKEVWEREGLEES